MKKFSAAAVVVFLVLAAIGTAWAAYPEKDIQGYITWGAGGGTDNVSRAMSAIAQETLGRTVIMQNRTGGSGAVGLTTVYNLPADGYSVLFAAENPSIYKVMGMSPYDYDNFIPIIIELENPATVVVPKDSPYKTFKDLIDAVKSGKEINMGATGPGGLAHTGTSMIQKVHGVKFNFVQFDGEAGAITSMMGNHIDALVSGLMSASSYVQSGAIRCLAILNNKRVDAIKDVPAINEIYPGEYDEYLPWGGAFYGVFVKEGTSQEVVNKLQEAYIKAFNDPKFSELINNLGGTLLGYTGDKAREYVDQHRSVTAWLLYDAGGAKFSPKDFNIPKPSK